MYLKQIVVKIHVALIPEGNRRVIDIPLKTDAPGSVCPPTMTSHGKLKQFKQYILQVLKPCTHQT